MRWLGTALLVAMVVTSAAHSAGASVDREAVKRVVVEEALRIGVPAELALAVARVESNFNPDALSSKGARGVMQIMPATAWGEFGIPADDLWLARRNIRLGVTYLRRLYDQYGQDWSLALSHYNGGTLRRKDGAWVAHGYTAGYVASVQAWQRRYLTAGTAPALLQGAGTLPEEPVRVARLDTPPAGTARPWRRPGAGSAPPLVLHRTWDSSVVTPNVPTRRHIRTIASYKSDGSLDDFDGGMGRRRATVRGSLDDFAPVVRWSDG